MEFNRQLIGLLILVLGIVLCLLAYNLERDPKGRKENTASLNYIFAVGLIITGILVIITGYGS